MQLNYILGYKNKIIHAIIIISAIILASNLYKSQTRDIPSLKTKKELEIKKIRVLGDINELTKIINFYKDLINKKDVSSVINTFNSIANSSDINIVTVRPIREQVYPLYIKYPFELIVRTAHYDNLGRFISKLENNPDIYIIDSIRIRGTNVRGQDLVELTANLKLSTVIFK